MKYLLIVAVMFCSCQAKKLEPGSVEGNVFWKYNDYVGNKPDAGSEVLLMSVDSTKDLKYSATTDVQGNFKIEQVEPGHYLLVVRSKNTTGAPEYRLNELISASGVLYHLTGYNFSEDKKEQLNKFKELEKKSSESLTGEPDPVKGYSGQLEEYDRLNKINRAFADSILDNLPDRFGKIGLYSKLSNKLHMTEVEVKEGQKHTEVVDFGVTYF